MFKKLTYGIVAVMGVVLASIMAVSCEPSTTPDDPSTTLSNSLSLPSISTALAAGSQFVTITANASWEISVDFGEVSEEWVTLNPTSGTAGTRKVTMSWVKNEGTEARTCTIVLKVGAAIFSQTFTQRGASTQTVEELNPDPVPGWLELPATNDDELYFFTHDMTLNGKTVRNYSFYLDPRACLAVWVAYPLNKGLIGNGSRTNDWGLDPKVPRQYQSVIFSGYKGGYDRGHQLPSADRLLSGANEATFYGTNMTPQRGELNQQAWATLEGKVRTWAASFDTLYVVTGCDIRDNYGYAYDNDGKAIPVPCGYFKALLGLKKSGTLGNASKQGGYTAIGFYFDHTYYEDSQIMGQSMTIDELEDLMDIDFFPNLESRIGQSLYTKVESTPDSWWQ